MSRALIVYYSRAGENYVNGTIKPLICGNTETAAEIIKELTGADIFKLEQSEQYSDNTTNVSNRHAPTRETMHAPH